MKERINSYLKNPSKLRASNKREMKKYINVIKYDDKTGEVFKGAEKITLNDKKIKEDQSLNGYYVIATSELDWKAEKILASYKSLWKIEESFKVMKSSFSARPIYVRREDRINAHFLICFISLTILRILENEIGISVFRVRKAIKSATFKNIGSAFYMLNRQSDDLLLIQEHFNVRFKSALIELKNNTQLQKIQTYTYRIKYRIMS